MVTADFFRTFGCRPSAGRQFSPSDLRGAGRGAVVSEALTRREPGLALTGVLTLGGHDYGMVGVMPDSCWFPSPGGPDGRAVLVEPTVALRAE